MKQLTAATRARYFRRQLVDRIMGGLCIAAAGVGLILLALILWMLFSNGLGGLTLDVFTRPMSQPGSGGGLANAIIGSLLQVGVGAMIGAPLGMMVGVYLSEV
ncbi:MAG: phosphate ABC transporter, permease protein PstA, partial [Hyphomonadaceae bacterium]